MLSMLAKQESSLSLVEYPRGSRGQRSQEEDACQAELFASAHLQLSDAGIGHCNDEHVAYHVGDGEAHVKPGLVDATLASAV